MTNMSQEPFKVEAYGEIILPDDPRHPRNRGQVTEEVLTDGVGLQRDAAQ